MPLVRGRELKSVKVFYWPNHSLDFTDSSDAKTQKLVRSQTLLYTVYLSGHNKCATWRKTV